MKKHTLFLTLIFSVVLFGGCMAQTHEVADTTLQKHWETFPNARPLLKQLFPDLFKLAVLDTTLFGGWKIYRANGEDYYAVQKNGANWISLIELGNEQGSGYAKAFINGDSLLVFGRSVSGSVPDHIQELIDKLNK